MAVSWLRYGSRIALLFAAYWLTARLGLALDPVGGLATPVWPPTGVALVALYLYGYRLWPAITLAAFAVNAEQAHHLGVALGVAIGNTLEAVMATYLLRRFGFQPSLQRVRDVVALVILAALLSTIFGASIGVTSGRLGGQIAAANAGRAWTAWWIGDLMGDLVVAPLLFLWLRPGRIQLERRTVAEIAVLLLLLVGLSMPAFDLWPIRPLTHQMYAVFPGLIWAALRFGQRGGVTATFLVSSLAIAGTVLHSEELVDALVGLQAFMAIVAVTILVLAAAVEERRASQADLEESETRYQDLYDRAPDLFMSVDASGVILKCNQTFLNVTGHAREDVVGRSVFDLHHPQSRAGAWEAWQEFILTGEVRDVELQLLRRDGSTLDVGLSMSSVRDEQGRVVYSRSVWRDITERKRAEVRLRWALKEKETLLREVNHRVRNNLAVIDGILQLQAHQAQEPNLAAALRDSRNRVRSIAIVHESLYRAKELARIDFADYIQGLCRHLFRAHGVDEGRIELRLDVKKVEVALELAIPLGLLLNELVSNALHHAFPAERSGWLAVSLKQEDEGRIVLAVQDNGIGLPQEVELVRPPTLGFDIVKSLLQQIGGRMAVVRVGGTKVTIECWQMQLGETASIEETNSEGNFLDRS